MKHMLAVVLAVVLGSPLLEAQWVQTSLGDAQYGYNLFSDTSGVWAATLNGVYSSGSTGDPWFSRGLPGRLVFDVIKSGAYVIAATEGSGPGVFRTSDNGLNWQPASGMTDQSVRAFTRNTTFLFACTWGGGVYRSSDDGGTWESVGLTNHGFRSMFAVGETVYAGGDNIFFSTDNGASWTARQLPFPAGDTRCFAYHHGTLYAGDMGLYASEDLGLTWNLRYGVKFDSAGTPIDVTMFSDLSSCGEVLVAAMSPGAIGISRDDGVSWNEWNEGLMPDWILAALAVRPPNIWALRGAFGNAYLRPLSETVTGAAGTTGIRPAAYELAQNYPNPFNPETVVRYQLPVVSTVTLTIYDVLGREVAVLVNEVKAPGTYEVVFDARLHGIQGSPLASAVYLYRLTARSLDFAAGRDSRSGSRQYVESRKMILLK